MWHKSPSSIDAGSHLRPEVGATTTTMVTILEAEDLQSSPSSNTSAKSLNLHGPELHHLKNGITSALLLLGAVRRIK